MADEKPDEKLSELQLGIRELFRMRIFLVGVPREGPPGAKSPFHYDDP
jgi:hypothetical protein